jgi:hypothetical protein
MILRFGLVWSGLDRRCSVDLFRKDKMKKLQIASCSIGKSSARYHITIV